jgi:hypothetical protein
MKTPDGEEDQDDDAQQESKSRKDIIHMCVCVNKIEKRRHFRLLFERVVFGAGGSGAGKSLSYTNFLTVTFSGTRSVRGVSS